MEKLALIINEIEKEKKVNYTDIFIRKDFSDLDILAIITYCYKNNIDDVSETFDIDFENIPNKYYSDEEVINYLIEEINYEKYDDDFLDRYFNITISEVIKNIRINFSFFDIKQEALMALLKFKNNYYDRLKQNYNDIALEYIIRNFVKRAIIYYQKLELDVLKEQELVYLLYVKIKSELKERKLDEILSNLGITKEYYEQLETIFSNEVISLTYDEILKESDRVTQKYDIALKTTKLTYMEEQALLIYLEKESKENNEDFDNMIKISMFKLSLIYSKESLDDIVYLQNEMENINVKIN